MPIRYVGRKTYLYGRPLWEILLNLKDFGVGRIVVRNIFLRYPEACYYKIISVKPTKIEYPNIQTEGLGGMHGSILTERTWRGVTEAEPFNLGSLAFKPNYSLIPKHEEEAFINSKAKPKPNTKVYPRYMDLPPLWQEFVKREKALQGLPVTPDDLRCPIIYSEHFKGRVAAEGETPTFNFNDYKPLHMSLYDGIDFNREKKSSQSS